MNEVLTGQSKVESFLEEHPTHYELLKPFKVGFVVNYVADFGFANTNIYLLA